MRWAQIRYAGAAAAIVAVVGAAVGAQSLFYRLGPAQPPGDGPKWEYLVVAESRPLVAAAVPEVTMQPLSQDRKNVPFPLEARGLEGRLNELGEAGWELVAVVGMVGSDQMYVFKRQRR